MGEQTTVFFMVSELSACHSVLLIVDRAVTSGATILIDSAAGLLPTFNCCYNY